MLGDSLVSSCGVCSFYICRIFFALSSNLVVFLLYDPLYGVSRPLQGVVVLWMCIRSWVRPGLEPRGSVYSCFCFLFSCDVAWTSFSFGFLAAAGARLLMDVSKTSWRQVRGCCHSARCRFVLGALV